MSLSRCCYEFRLCHSSTHILGEAQEAGPLVEVDALVLCLLLEEVAKQRLQRLLRHDDLQHRHRLLDLYQLLPGLLHEWAQKNGDQSVGQRWRDDLQTTSLNFTVSICLGVCMKIEPCAIIEDATQTEGFASATW